MQFKEKYKFSEDGHEIALQAWEMQLLWCSKMINIDLSSSDVAIEADEDHSLEWVGWIRRSLKPKTFGRFIHQVELPFVVLRGKFSKLLITLVLLKPS